MKRELLFLLRGRWLRTEGQNAETLLWLSMLQIDHHIFLKDLHPLKKSEGKFLHLVTCADGDHLSGKHKLCNNLT